jgi:hypothetical protein
MQGIIATQPVEYPDMVGQLSDVLVLLGYIGVRSRTLQSAYLAECGPGTLQSAGSETQGTTRPLILPLVL